MRIAFDARSVYQGMGGIGRYSACLMDELGRLDTSNSYTAYFTRIEAPKVFRAPEGWDIRRFETGMIDERFDHLVLPGLLAEDQIDLYFNPTFAVPLVRSRARTVATVHDVVFRRHPALVPPRLRSYLDRATAISCRTADGIITVSEFSKSEILALYPVGKRVDVIHNGVHAPPSQRPPTGQLRSAFGLQPRKYVLYVGTLEPKKNIDLLLKAFAEVQGESGTDFLTLTLVGSHDPEAYPLAPLIARLGIEKCVRLLGHVSESDLEALYADALLFVYPSLYEGFGLPPIEAMARGVPTIVSGESSLPEVVGDAAIIAPSESPKAFAQAIRDLANDLALRNELRVKGISRAKAFSWLRSAKSHLEVFKRVMEAA